MRAKTIVILFLSALFLLASKCNNGGDELPEPFDHQEQQEKDQALLDEYLTTHYLTEDGDILPVSNGETPLSQIVEEHEYTQYFADSDQHVDMKYYTYTLQEGVGESPTYVDMVHAAYTLEDLTTHQIDQVDYGVWLHLYKSIKAWQLAMPEFKEGNKIDNGDGTFTYENAGKYLLILPSGLGYMNLAQEDFGANTCLVFHITLNEVFRTDYDEDGILSMNEDVDNDGKYEDDTDDDTIFNYLDNDDDGDGILTIDEDANGDGDPTNDDSDQDGTPDYLDPDPNE